MNKLNTLRKNHRNLFFAVMVFGVWGILHGLVILAGEALILGSGMAVTFGTSYIIFGGMKLIGGTFNNIGLARAGMVGCMCLSTIFSGIALVKYLGGDIRAPLIALDTFVLGLVQLSAISEPQVQPLTMKQGQ